MDKNKLLETLKASQGLDQVEEIDYKPEFLVVRFFYNYDGDELGAAKDYANSECGEGESEDKWYDDYYIPYLTDIAVDEISDSLEEAVEGMQLNTEYVNYQPERDDTSCEFVAVFTDDDREFDIDEILDAIGA